MQYIFVGDHWVYTDTLESDGTIIMTGDLAYLEHGKVVRSLLQLFGNLPTQDEMLEHARADPYTFLETTQPLTIEVQQQDRVNVSVVDVEPQIGPIVCGPRAIAMSVERAMGKSIEHIRRIRWDQSKLDINTAHAYLIVHLSRIHTLIFSLFHHLSPLYLLFFNF